MRVSRGVQAAASTLFLSAKTTVAIPTSCSLVRDALVQASLDPGVRTIEFLAQARVAATPVELNAIIIVRDDGRFVLDVVPARPVRDVEDDIKREPRFANSNLVWSYRMRLVGIGLRMRTLQILADEGPMALSRLLSTVWSDRDPSSAVMSLACADLIELDLVSQPLGPDTIVRARA